MLQRLNLTTVLLLLPATAFFFAFALGPMLVAAYISFLEWDGVSAPRWVGFENWVSVFSEPFTYTSIFITVALMLLNWAFQTPLSLLLGVYLAGRQRYRAILGVFYFIPLLFSAVAVGITWQYILDPSFGILNTALRSVGASMLAKNWLGDPNLALAVMAVVISWQYVPFHTLLYHAGARQIPQVLYEAARIDGAGTFARFFYITLPQLKYTVVTSSILIFTGTLTSFDLIYVMTEGGPGNATRILPLHQYITAFQELLFGPGSVIAIILAVFGIGLSIFLLRITGYTKMESQAEGL
jgi:raffinose/stachyose/melibiose transport system permease protein